jgi:protein required for attachment to host cells
MIISPGTLVAVVDGEKLALFENTGHLSISLTPRAMPHVAERASGTAGHTSSSANPDNDTQAEDGFAMGVAEVLNRLVLDHKVEQLLVIAAPRTTKTGEVKAMAVTSVSGPCEKAAKKAIRATSFSPARRRVRTVAVIRWVPLRQARDRRCPPGARRQPRPALRQWRDRAAIRNRAALPGRRCGKAAA